MFYMEYVSIIYIMLSNATEASCENGQSCHVFPLEFSQVQSVLAYPRAPFLGDP